jgi:hypothetical protein
MNLISKWLAGKRNYHIGVVLYNHFTKGEKLMWYFAGGPDKFKQQKLEKELQELNKKLIVVSPGISVDQDTEEMPKSTDPVLLAMRTDWLVPYQKMQYLRHELDRYTRNDKESIAIRCRLAKEILELEQGCMAVWRRRDHYMKTGKLPEVKDPADDIPTDPLELARLIHSLERNIRRNKALAIKHPGSAVYPLRAHTYQVKLDRIKSQQK